MELHMAEIVVSEIIRKDDESLYQPVQIILVRICFLD
jgi:hypothetical protein